MPYAFRWPWAKIETKTEEQQSQAISVSYQYGKVIVPHFSEQMGYYLSDTHVKAAIDHLADSWTGLGFWISGKNKDAVTAIEDFCEDINLDRHNANVSRELLATGNSIRELDTPESIKKIYDVPISSIWKLYASPQGILTKIEQKVESSPITTLDEQKLKRMLWLKINDVDASLRGVGLTEPLTRSGLGYTWVDGNNVEHVSYRPTYMQIKEENEDSMRKILHRYVPRHVYELAGFDNETTIAHGKTIKSLRPEDDLVINTPNPEKGNKINITRVGTDPRSRLEPMFQYFNDGIYTALENPVLRLFLEAGFTEASATVAVSELHKKIAAYERILARIWERELFKRVLMDSSKPYGLVLNEKEYKDARVRLKWEQEMEWQMIVGGYKAGFVKRDEARKRYEKMGMQLIEGEEEGGGYFVQPTSPFGSTDEPGAKTP